MASFPTTIVSFTNPSSSNFLNNPAHATQHSNENDEIVAIETKIGTGVSTPSNNTYLKGTGTGTSSWQPLTINRAFSFFIAGVVAVANDLSWNPVAPQALTCIKTWAYARTAPTGANLIISLYNVTQAAVIGTVTISAGAQTGNSTSFTTAAIVAGDVIRCDITQVGSSVAGSDISVILESTQP